MVCQLCFFNEHILLRMINDDYSLINKSTAAAGLLLLVTALSHYNWSTIVAFCEISLFAAAWIGSATSRAGFNLLILDWLRNWDESILNIVSSFGTSFEECHAELLRECSPLLGADHLLVEHVGLISNQHFLHVLTGVQLYLTHPVAYVIEAVLHGAVVGKNYTHRALVVGLGDRSKALLPCGVPNLQFYVLAIDLNGFDLEINSYKEN